MANARRPDATACGSTAGIPGRSDDGLESRIGSGQGQERHAKLHRAVSRLGLMLLESAGYL
jgi:hypothetical protein